MNKYLVAQEVGGRMQNRATIWVAYQLIEAETPEKACEIYDKKNKCVDYKSTCLGEYDETTGRVTVPVTLFIHNCCLDQKE